MLQAGCSPLGVWGSSGSTVGAAEAVQQIFMNIYRSMVLVVSERFAADKSTFFPFLKKFYIKRSVSVALTHGWTHRDLAQLFCLLQAAFAPEQHNMTFCKPKSSSGLDHCASQWMGRSCAKIPQVCQNFGLCQNGIWVCAGACRHLWPGTALLSWALTLMAHHCWRVSH